MNGFDACKQIKELYSPKIKLFALEQPQVTPPKRMNSDIRSSQSLLQKYEIDPFESE